MSLFPYVLTPRITGSKKQSDEERGVALLLPVMRLLCGVMFL